MASGKISKHTKVPARAAREAPAAPYAAPAPLPVRLPAQAGQILFGRRKALKLSQAEVAAKLGIGQSRYSELESRPGSMSVEHLFALAAILGVDILMHGEAAPRPGSAAEW
jgi:HTH-type transcriptional regulator/antitoxin HipB